MKRDSHVRRTRVPGAWGLSLLASFFWVAFVSNRARAADGPDKMLGPRACGECHGAVLDIWKQTSHYEIFWRMHRRRQAARIADRLDLARIKHNTRCAQCHYTTILIDQEPHVVAGVSCESCHGPARDWNKAHSNPNDPDRLKRAESLGLIRPANLYGIVSRCYACHTVPDEDLVNRGEHPAGSDFELVSWLQGEVRHNIMRSDGRINEEAPLGRRRMMYVLGWALDLEYGLRGLAGATEKGDYADALVARILHAQVELQRIQQLGSIPQIAAILRRVEPPSLSINNRANLLQAAEAVSELARGFAATADSSQLGSLDALLPSAKDYCGQVHQPKRDE